MQIKSKIPSRVRVATLLTILSLGVSFGSIAKAKPQGGVSGGGGNVIDARPPDKYTSPEVVENIVESMPVKVIRYLHLQLDALKNGNLSDSAAKAYTSLFNAPANVFQVVQNIDVRIEDHRPCRDRYDQPVDGSIFSKHSDEICISGFNISTKVHDSEIHPQAFALLIHEYSEVAGLDEDSAVALQTQVLKELKK
jgi:hypothetical protein